MDVVAGLPPLVLAVAGLVFVLVGVPLFAAAVYVLVPEFTWVGRAARTVLHAYGALLRGTGRVLAFALDALWWW